MRNKKIAGAFAATAVIASGFVALSAPVANAAAVNPSGGCATFFAPADLPLLDTAPRDSYLGAPNGAWSDEDGLSNPPIPANPVLPEYELTTAGSTTVGGERTFALTYDKGMLSFAAATGPAHWFFSVNGTMLPAITKTRSEPAQPAVGPGDTIEGDFTIADVGTNEVVFEKMIFEVSGGVRVVCSGQTGNTLAVNPHTVPIATNVKDTFTAVGPTIELQTVKYAGTVAGNQTENDFGRAGDTINIDTSVFATTDAGTLQLCDDDGVSNCEGAGTVTGNGLGTLTIPTGATTGARKLVATVGAEKARADFNVLGQATLDLSLNAGGVGTTITLDGDNYDPGQDVVIQGITNVLPLGGPPTNTADASVTVQADENGVIEGSYLINDAETRAVTASQPHRSPVPFNMANLAGITATTGADEFIASANSCTAKVDAADLTGSCSVVQTLDLDVTAGALTMAQITGDIAMEAIQLDGTDQVSEGSINDIVVKDYRNGTLGWTLNVTFDGMSGAGTIAPSALSLVGAACTEAANNSNTVDATSGTFADAATAISICDTNLAPAEVSSGDTTVSSGLELDIASDTAPGNYTGNLTFTLS